MAARAQRLRAAAFDAIGPDDLREILQVAADAAKAGDMVAARFVVERCLGRPRDERAIAEPLDVDLGDLATADGCSAALQRVAAALQAGRITADEAAAVTALVAQVRDGVVVADLETRLAAIEREAPR